MTIDEAVTKLAAHLGDPEVFMVRHDGKTIIVDVNFIYRVKDVTALGSSWEGHPISTGRRSLLVSDGRGGQCILAGDRTQTCPNEGLVEQSQAILLYQRTGKWLPKRRSAGKLRQPERGPHSDRRC